MSNQPQDFSSEIRISLQPVLVVFIIAATLILFSASDNLLDRNLSMIFATLLATASVLLWRLDNTHSLLARWFTVILLVLSISGWGLWHRMPETFFMLLLSVALAGALIGVSACVIIAVGVSALLGVGLLMSSSLGFAVTPSSALIFLMCLWGTVGIILAIYIPIEKLALWAWHYYREAQIGVEQARDSKAELTQMVEDLEYTNRQLALLNERAIALRWVAEDAQQAKAAFVARVSHEFRTPLNIIIGMVNLLVENPEVYEYPLPDKAQNHIRIVYRNCQHLASMINDVLTLSQAQSGRITLHQTYAQLEQEIRAAGEIVQPMITEKHLSYSVVIPEDLPLVYCDQTRIRQILLNLLSNAARLTLAGSITITAKTANGQVIISVKDTGPGIAPDEVERIFEPFFQGSVTPWNDDKSSGLGLSISRQFVALHGGRMWVESEVGVGSTFYIELPIEPIPALVPSPTRWIQDDWEWRDRQNRPTFTPSHYRPRYVVWHENQNLAERSAWTSDSVEWIHTASRETVNEILSQGTCRALLVNTVSPNGVWSAVEHARTLFPDIPVMGCSYSDPDNPLIKSGADAYLIKPLTQVQLSRVIEGINRSIKHVLVVDDDADSRELLTTFLSIYDRSMTVTAVATGYDAFDIMGKVPVDLVLLDLLLKDENGADILSRMKDDPKQAVIPVIMVTAQDAHSEAASSPLLLVSMGTGLVLDKITDGVRYLSELMVQAEGVES